MNKLFEKTPIWQLFIVYIIANIVNVVLTLTITNYFDIAQSVMDELMRAFMFTIVLLWFIFLIFKNKIGLSLEFKNLKEDIRPKEWINILIFNYALSLVIIFVLMLGLSLVTYSSMDSVAESSQGGVVVVNYTSTLINFIATSFIVPIAEELMFRGVLLNRLRKKVNIVSAVVISSVLFGMTHLSLALLGSIIFGVCMCAVYLRTKNIVVPIVMHITHNLILSIVQSKGILWGTQSVGDITTMDISPAMSFGGIIIFGIISIACGLYLSRKYQLFNFKQYQQEQI